MTTKLQSLTELWQEFNLTGTQKLLDELATEISSRQDESDASRKQLIDLIRNFKKTNTEETRLVFSSYVLCTFYKNQTFIHTTVLFLITPCPINFNKCTQLSKTF